MLPLASFCLANAWRIRSTEAVAIAAAVSRLLCVAWKSATPSDRVGFDTSSANTSLTMVRFAAWPILRGTSENTDRSSLMMAWRVIENSLP